jgi:hypothetical protein
MTILPIRVQSYHHVPVISNAAKLVYSNLSISNPIINL